MEADWRGLAGYSVQFQIQDSLKLTVRELYIPRTAEEFSTLDTQIRQKFPLSVSGILVLPETFSIDSLNDYISVFMTTNTLRTSQLFEDFATINYKDCFEVKWFKDMSTLPTVFEARLSTFWPVPPKLQPRGNADRDWRRHEHGRHSQRACPRLQLMNLPRCPFTIPLTGSTIVATAAVVTTCSSPANCTDSLTPTCSGSVCIAMPCGGGSFTPDGAYDSLWDSVKPMKGKYTINCFQYQEDVGCVCVLNDWISSNDEICADNYNYFRFKLKGNGRSEFWEVYLYGDQTIKVDRDSAELGECHRLALMVSASVLHPTW